MIFAKEKNCTAEVTIVFLQKWKFQTDTSWEHVKVDTAYLCCKNFDESCQVIKKNVERVFVSQYRKLCKVAFWCLWKFLLFVGVSGTAHWLGAKFYRWFTHWLTVDGGITISCRILLSPNKIVWRVVLVILKVSGIEKPCETGLSLIFITIFFVWWYRNNCIKEFFCDSVNFWYQKILCISKNYHDFASKIFHLTLLKYFVEGTIWCLRIFSCACHRVHLHALK